MISIAITKQPIILIILILFLALLPGCAHVMDGFDHHPQETGPFGATRYEAKGIAHEIPKMNMETIRSESMTTGEKLGAVSFQTLFGCFLILDMPLTFAVDVMLLPTKIFEMKSNTIKGNDKSTPGQYDIDQVKPATTVVETKANP